MFKQLWTFSPPWKKYGCTTEIAKWYGVQISRCDFFLAGLSQKISRYYTVNSMIVYYIIIVGFITASSFIITLTSAGRLVVVCFDPSPSDDFTSGDGGATAAMATMGDWLPVLVPGSDFVGFFSSVRFRLCITRAKNKNKTELLFSATAHKTTHTRYRRNRILIFARQRWDLQIFYEVFCSRNRTCRRWVRRVRWWLALVAVRFCRKTTAVPRKRKHARTTNTATRVFFGSPGRRSLSGWITVFNIYAPSKCISTTNSRLCNWHRWACYEHC